MMIMEAVTVAGQTDFMGTAKKAVASYLNEVYPDMGPEVTVADVYVVWFCKTLQNWKALLSTDVVTTGIYFEVTYNGDKGELYLDHYVKAYNAPIKVETP